MVCNLSRTTIDDRAKRDERIVLLGASQFCFQSNGWRSTMQSVWQDLYRTKTRRLHLTSHLHAAIWNKQCALRVIALSPSLSLSPLTPAHRTTLLLYYERGGFDVVPCVPISTLLWQQRRTQACDWLSPADAQAAHWLAAAVWACCSFAMAATGDGALAVWVCLLEERREHNRRRLRFIFICSLRIYAAAERDTAGNYAYFHCSIIVSKHIRPDPTLTGEILPL